MSRTTDADSAKSIVALVGAIVAILIWTLIGFPNTLKGVSGPNDLAALYGNMTGVGFAHALIVGLIAYFAFIRRWAPRRAAIYFLILVLVSVGANLALFSIVRHAARNNAQRDGVQAQIATREIGDALHAALKANAGGGPIDTTPKAQGDSGEMERIMKQWLALQG
jgi:membrane protease YdiL (CAAX protease family)